MTLHAALRFVEVQALLPVMVTGAGQDANAIPRFPSLYSKRKEKGGRNHYYNTEKFQQVSASKDYERVRSLLNTLP